MRAEIFDDCQHHYGPIARTIRAKTSTRQRLCDIAESNSTDSLVSYHNLDSLKVHLCKET